MKTNAPSWYRWCCQSVTERTPWFNEEGGGYYTQFTPVYTNTHLNHTRIFYLWPYLQVLPGMHCHPVVLPTPPHVHTTMSTDTVYTLASPDLLVLQFLLGLNGLFKISSLVSYKKSAVGAWWLEEVTSRDLWVTREERPPSRALRPEG